VAPKTVRYVLVHEKEKRGWWLPGGGVDAGQTLAEAAIRESVEEAGCETELTGVLRIEYSRGSGRLRVIWRARPTIVSDGLPAAPLKSVPDAESRGARWTDVAEMRAVADGTATEADGSRLDHCWLRGEEPLWWFTYLASGGRVAPASLVCCTRDAPPRPWSGPGSPPRAVYPTRTAVEVLAVAPSGAVLLREGAMPRADSVGAREPLEAIDTHQPIKHRANAHTWPPSQEVARLLVEAATGGGGGGVALGGVLRFAHDLHVADADTRLHRASVTVTFVAETRSAEPPAAAAGWEWAAPATLEGSAPHAAEWARAVHRDGMAAACVAPLSAVRDSRTRTQPARVWSIH